MKHQLIGRGLVYCTVSLRTEGTVRMEGRVCSYCGHRLVEVAR